MNRTPEKRMLNLGCGSRYNRCWINVDLAPQDPQVIKHNLLTGIPFADNHFHAVYHSHLLEHLSLDEGVKLMRECYRVLEPGGILRVVVPDLEKIAELYLKYHNLALQGDRHAKANYQWMKLELLDQFVRVSSGGAMGSYINNPETSNLDFVRARVGNEVNLCIEARSTYDQRKKSNSKSILRRIFPRKIRNFLKNLRPNLAAATVNFLMGPRYRQAFEECLFRSGGEIHKWMYDRFSLTELCHQVGFHNVVSCDASTSRIHGFSEFQLDGNETEVYKPDSLFLECQKPKVPANENVKGDSVVPNSHLSQMQPTRMAELSTN